MTQQPSRREKEKLRQRQEIMTTALALFSEKGYHNVSMHEIAANAEFAIGTLYKFFRNKGDLYKSLLLEKFDRFHAALLKAIELPGDEVEKLRRYVQTKVKVFGNDSAILYLYFLETGGAGFNVFGELEQYIRDRQENLLLQLAEIFESGIQTGRFHQIAPPYLLAVALDSLCNASLFFSLKSPENHSYLERPDIILNILLKGLVSL